MTLVALAAQTRDLAGLIPGRQANTVSLHAHLLIDRLPRALHNIRLELTCHDGYPNSTPGASDRGHGGKGGISRPTEVATMIRLGDGDGPASDLADLYEFVTMAHDQTRQARYDEPDIRLHGALVALKAAHKICDRHMGESGHRPDQYRCAGDGTPEGANCTNVRDYRVGDGGVILESGDGRCSTCRARAAEAEAHAAEEALRRRVTDRETRRRLKRRA